MRKHKPESFIATRKDSQWNLGRCPKNLQGSSPLTHNRAPPEPALLRAQEREMPLSFWKSVIRRTFVKRLSRHNGAPAPLFHDPPDNAPAPGYIRIFPVVLFPYLFFYCPLLLDLFTESAKDVGACGKVQLNVNAFFVCALSYFICMDSSQ